MEIQRIQTLLEKYKNDQLNEKRTGRIIEWIVSIE